MSDEPPFKLIDADRARLDAEAAFERVKVRLAAMLPAAADILHVGATAVPGCFTKGDLDIVVRVPASAFGPADAALARHFERNTGSTHTATFSAFMDDAGHPHLGIQLAVIDSPDDCFHQFAEALRASHQLLEEYNALKRRFDGRDMSDYRAAKDAFIARVLAPRPVDD